MSVKHLSTNPQQISATDWYYEEASGLEVIHEVRDLNSNQYIRTDRFFIPWSKVRASLKRKDTRR